MTHRDGSFAWQIPVPDPEKILCVRVNFSDRNAEHKNGSAPPRHMSLFPRFARSFTGHGRPLIRPPENHTLDCESEVAVVIGKGDAYDHIAALTLCNEGTVRDWVRHAKFNVTQGKNWDRSGAMGSWLVTFDDPAQLDEARIVTRVNGETRQDGVREQIAYISTFTTLAPGDIIVTGTPTGAVGAVRSAALSGGGDVVEVAGIGCLRNAVADE